MSGKQFLIFLTLLCSLLLAGCGGSSSNGGGSQSASITVAPTSANVPAGSTQQFTATVTGPPITLVNWEVNGVVGGNKSVGAISATGLYTAPSSIPNPATVTVTAVSQADSSLTATAKATVTAPIVVSIATTGGSSIPVTQTRQFTATVTGTTNTAVNWQVNGVAGGNSTVGTISSSGLYTAPGTVPSPSNVSITAVSKASSNASASVPLTVTVLVTISPLKDTIGVRANRQFVANVLGSSNTGVSWQVTGGGTTDDGNIDANGYYFAPDSPTPSPVSVSAIADADNTTTSAPASVTVQANDPLGTVSSVQTIPCPTGTNAGVAGGTCSSMVVSCDGAADINAYIKVNSPNSGSNGVVIFGTGTGGSNLYDVDPNFQSGNFEGGYTVVSTILQDGWTTAQVSFGGPFVSTQPNGWLQGPGGVRRLACRYATVADWIYKNIYNGIHNSNASAAMCATGNSGGAGAIAYALGEYGLGSGSPPEISMAELTSGPPMGRLDEACSEPSATVCQPVANMPCSTNPSLSLCYSTADAAVVDPAYATPACTNSIDGNPPADAANVFLSDSAADGTLPSLFKFSDTYVNLLFGGLDASAAVPQGVAWADTITTSTTAPKMACVSDAPHSLPSVTDGADQIVTDITSNCKLQ